MAFELGAKRAFWISSIAWRLWRCSISFFAVCAYLTIYLFITDTLGSGHGLRVGIANCLESEITRPQTYRAQKHCFTNAY
jgi:hypothetical protein